jgi:N utilization substance protein A
MINKDFFAALEELEKEKKIDRQVFLESLEAGLVSAYKKETGEQRPIEVRLNDNTHAIKVYALRTVVEDVYDAEKEISLEEAKEYKQSYKVGDTFYEDITPKNFSRIAAQTAKQVIMQRLNDANKERVMSEMNEKSDEILQAIVRRIDGDTVYVEMVGSQLEGVMLPNDQVKGERYKLGDMIKVYIKNIKSTAKGAQVMVSRSAAGLVKRLFEMEVPEISSGLVIVKNIVRDAGYRTKMAVASEMDRVDPVGACIGQKGVRINAIINELGGEKVDIVAWSEDIGTYISKAMSPAEVRYVRLDEENKSARVVVPDEKLSLAIGKGGQNVRLAAKLTGWKIDVKPLSEVREEVNAQMEFSGEDEGIDE